MKPRVLILYYSFTNQTRRVAEAMSEVLGELDCEVEECAVEFIDEQYHLQLADKPQLLRTIMSLLPAQLRGKTGRIRVPDEVLKRDYDLICIGSPTWWFFPAMPIVSFLESEGAKQLLENKRFAVFAVCRAIWWHNLRQVKRMAQKQGGTFVDGAAFCFDGGYVRSELSFISYLKNDADLGRFWGFKIYKFGVSDEGIAKAKEFAQGLGRGLLGTISSLASHSTTAQPPEEYFQNGLGKIAQCRLSTSGNELRGSDFVAPDPFVGAKEPSRLPS
mgnify:CR=1 FL=1